MPLNYCGTYLRIMLFFARHPHQWLTCLQACHSTNEPEILQVNRFSSELVHRHIKIADYVSRQYIMQATSMSQQIFRVNHDSEPKLLHGNWIMYMYIMHLIITSKWKNLQFRKGI